MKPWIREQTKEHFSPQAKKQQSAVQYIGKTGSQITQERITAEQLNNVTRSLQSLFHLNCDLTYTRGESNIKGVDACQSKVCNLDFSKTTD